MPDNAVPCAVGAWRESIHTLEQLIGSVRHLI